MSSSRGPLLSPALRAIGLIAGVLLFFLGLGAGVYSAYVLLLEGAASPWWAWGGYFLLCVTFSSLIIVGGGSNVVERTMALVLAVILMVPLVFFLGAPDSTIAAALGLGDSVERQTIALLMLGPTGAAALWIAIAEFRSSRASHRVR